MPIKAAYTGTGEHFMGVPATDLTDDDWDRMSDAQKEAVRASSFYRMIEAPSAVRRAAPTVERAALPVARVEEPASSASPQAAPTPSAAKPEGKS